jgi:hypothetical protein
MESSSLQFVGRAKARIQNPYYIFPFAKGETKRG